MYNQLFQFSSYQFNPHAIPIMAVSLLIFFIGVLIIWQTRRTVRDTAFFLFCMSSTLWLFTMGFVYSSRDPQNALLMYKTFTFFGVINLTPNLYMFAAAVSGRLDKERIPIILTYLSSYAIYFGAHFTDKFVTMQPAYFWGYYPHYEPLNYVFIIIFCVTFAANQIHLKLAYEREEIPIKKKQIRMIKLSLLFGLTAFIDFGAKLWRVPIYPAGFISMFILICLLAYSIIRYKAFDIETVIHKTILWILSFSIIVVPIIAAYRLVYPYMAESQFQQILFGIVCLIAFAVYMRQFQPKIDHIFQRRKANLEEISSRFAEDLVQLKGIENLTQRIEETLLNALYPQRVGIYIYSDRKKEFILMNFSEGKEGVWRLDHNEHFLKWLGANNKIVYRDFVSIDPQFADVKDSAEEYFKKTRATVVIPVVLNKELLGIVHLDKKANLERYNALDFSFLTKLKNQSAIAISNSLIYEDIEEQVKMRTEELVEMQKQLIQAEKLATVGTLSGGVAHEINNPLASILTNVQMLLAFSKDETVEADRETLEMIEEATQRCRTIVQKLMVYAKKPKEEKEDVTEINMRDVLKNVTGFLSYQLEIDGITIEINANGADYRVRGNRNELEQVLTNIILNARDAIKPDKATGVIQISLAKENGTVLIRVKDEGKGMTEEVKSKIFDPFFTTKDVGKGLGLGLSICHSIIQKHKGTIEAASETDKGSVFTIKLPGA